MKIALSKIKPSPDNAAGRSEMNEAMGELVSTIKALGVVEPITVFPNGKGFEIIEGERRWSAAKQAGLKEVDVYVREDVDKEQARLLRLAALTNEDWAQAEFAKKVWEECRFRSKTAKELAELTGLSYPKLTRAIAFHTGALEGTVVEIDGEIAVYQTYTLHQRLSDKQGGNPEIRKAIAEKMSAEGVEAKPSEKLCARVKKSLSNMVAFGQPEDEDYEEHNFELDAILRVPWGADDYANQVKYISEGIEDEERKRWGAARFDQKAMKKFTDALIAWKKALKEVNRTKDKFSAEAAQFCVNAMEEIREVEDEIMSFFREKEKELPNG